MEQVDNAIYFQLFDLKPGKGDLKRLAIIEAALECIAEKGLENLTFDAVGEILGIRRSHVAYYYSNLELLVYDVVKYITTTAQAVTVRKLRGAESGQERLLAIVDGAFDWVKEKPKQAVVMSAFYYLAARNPEYRRLHTQIREAGLKRITDILKSEAALRKKSSLKKEILAKNIQALITGNLMEYLTTDRKTSIEKVREITREVVLSVVSL